MIERAILMRPLIETNSYLRDPEARRRMLEEDVYQSSVFEGARGLKKPEPQKPSRKRRSTASAKKRVKDS